ncbi:MAG: IncP-type conjugal transfer protein TraG [Desulfobulbus sp.]|nr:IncP-type conjugal transfer protein TraG [Desulfobulbus sp.]
MKPTKFLLFTSLMIIAVFVLGLWTSTQFVAKWLAYQPELGPPLLVIKGWPVYVPWKFLAWYFHYGAYAPRQFENALWFSYFGSISGVIFAVYLSLARARRKTVPTSHGTASWSTKEDLKKAGLLEGKGVVIGVSSDGNYLRHDGPEHVMAIAPTRSGKGVGIIIPTLLTWPNSVIVTDIKGENWGITAGYRKRALKNRVMKFDPTASDGSSVKYNPLEEIRMGTRNEVRDAQNIADILVDPQGTGQLDHWAKTGHALLVGTILHILYAREIRSKNLTSVASFLSDPNRGIDQTIASMLTAKHDPELNNSWLDMTGRKTATHPVVAAAARELLNKSDNERSGVLSTAMSFLGLYRDPIVAANTCSSEFKISDLMYHDDPVSLYLVVPPSDLSRTRPLMRMIINQIGRTLTESLEFKEGKPVAAYQHRLLLLLDEFPALGRLDFFESALAFIAGYGMKALLVVQSLNQLKKTYGPHNSIMDNCHIRIVFTPNDNDTAELISRMLGQKTEIVNNQSLSGDRMSLWLKHMSYSTQETGRPLLTPGEVSILPYEEEIIFLAGHPPIRARKLFYYQDRNFMRRVVPAPGKSDICRSTGLPDLSVMQKEPAGEGATGVAVTPETSGSILSNRHAGSSSVPFSEKADEEAEMIDVPLGTADDETEEDDDYLHSILVLNRMREEEQKDHEHDRGISL